MKKNLFLKQAGMVFVFIFSMQNGLKAQEKSQCLTLDLDMAIRIALSENPTIKVADIEITRKDYSYKGAIGNLLPTIAAS